MRKGKVVDHTYGNDSGIRNSDFSIEFDHSKFGPYTYLYDRQRLYFDEKLNERGSYFFPLKDSRYDNTELFIERNDIVIAIGERGSFSGESRKFLEIVNISSANKYRLYPDEVSLIYNSKEHIIVYYKKSGTYKCLKLSIQKLEKQSHTSVKMSAFFKLLYNHSTGKYLRLIYKPNSRSHMAGYFTEEVLENKKTVKKDIPWLNMVHHEEPTGLHSEPSLFVREEFLLQTNTHQKIDVWEASLTGKL